MQRDQRQRPDFTADDAHAFASRLRGDPSEMNADVPARGDGVAQWPVKVYAGGRRISLPPPRPWWARSSEEPEPDRTSRISELLLHSAGITRAIWRPGGTTISSPQRPHMVWPSMQLGHRRTVPSGGAMYPTEVYLVDLAREDEGGVFHYDPAHHALVSLEHPSAHQALRAALRLQPRAPVSALWVILSHRFAKNTFKYGNFAYRLGAADLGVVWGRVSELGGRLFGRVTTTLDFDDEALARLCGNDPCEEPAYLAVGLGAGGRETTTVEAALPTPSRPVDPPAVVDRGPAVAPSAALLAMHRAACTVPSASTPPTVDHGVPAELEPSIVARGARVDEDIVLSGPDPSVRPDARTLAIRRSAGAYFVDRPVDLAVLETVLSRTMEAIQALCRTVIDGNPPRLQLMCAVDRVRSVDPGWFLYQLGPSRLVPIEGPGAVPPSRTLQDALHAKTVDLERSAFSVHIASELDFRTHPRGPRAYRCQQFFVGAAIDAVTRWSTACGVGSHPLHGFDSARIDACYGLDHGPLGVLASVAVGHTRPGGTLEASVSS